MMRLPPSSVTVSELESFDRCPMEFFLKYERQVPAQVLGETPVTALPGNLLGDLVHAVIHRLLVNPEGRVADFVAHQATSREIPLALILIDEIAALCGRAMAFHRKRHWISFQAEVPFVIRVDGTPVHGTIDFLGKDAAGWHIVDYKTDRLAAKRDMTERARSYHLQLMAYAAAAACAGIAPLADTTLLFLRADGAVVKKVGLRETDAALRRISDILVHITDGDWDIRATPPCRQCPYHHNRMCWKDRLK